MGSQGGGGTMSSGSASKARETVSGYSSGSPPKLKREKSEKLGKMIMKNVFKKKEPAK
jgi:hypothetical protein